MTTNSRNAVLWSVLAIFLVAIAAVVVLTGGLLKRKAEQGGKSSTIMEPGKSAILLDVTGSVSAKGGRPLPVRATVFVASAAPKTGTSTFCPSCYADCRKRAQTDGQGHFKIKALDSDLTFQILAVAKGYKPKYLGKVDPAKRKPVKIILDPITSADAAPECSLHGRVVDPKGAPIEGAVVEMEGIETKDGGAGGEDCRELIRAR